MRMSLIGLFLAVLLLTLPSTAGAVTWALGLGDIYAHGGLDVDISGPEYGSVSSIADPFGGTIALTPTVERLYVPTSWATWSHNYTGPVLFSGYGVSSVRLDFDCEVTAFGFYAEPNSGDYFDVTLGLETGETLTKSVTGVAGAEFFGFYDGAVDWLEVSSTDALGFGMGEMAMAHTCVPEPGTLMLLGSGLLGLGLFRRRK